MFKYKFKAGDKVVLTENERHYGFHQYFGCIEPHEVCKVTLSYQDAGGWGDYQETLRLEGKLGIEFRAVAFEHASKFIPTELDTNFDETSGDF